MPLPAFHRTMMRLGLAAVAAACALALPATASATSAARFGIHDDAWLASGPGTLESRLDRLERLGVDVVRFSVRWDEVATRRPAKPASPSDSAYRWSGSDAVLEGLRAHDIDALVTLVGTPAWANGGRGPMYAPARAGDFRQFAYAAAKRYPWVRDWLIWNEPNQARWLRPTSAAVYVRQLLNPAYAGIKAANRRARVGGGVSAPRANAGGVSPVKWIRGIRAAGGRLDAYAHHPYPARPKIETPFTGGCARCESITLADLDRLIALVRKTFPGKRIWLTEYGYQTNPPDRLMGVSPQKQAAYIGQASLRVHRAPLVDMLIHYLVADEPVAERWQSGLFDERGTAKPAALAFPFPLATSARRGGQVALWGMVRPRRGAQAYRLQARVGGTWKWTGVLGLTNTRGAFARTITAKRGTLVRLYSPIDRAYSWPIVVG